MLERESVCWRDIERARERVVEGQRERAAERERERVAIGRRWAGE